MKRLPIFATLCALLVGISAMADEAKLDGVNCVVANRPAKAEQSADHNGAKVYFCCGNCKGKFTENPKEFTAQANRQLVQTGQATQKACPLAGRPVKVSVDDGVKIGFCCNNCKGKYEQASADDRLKLVFSEAAFAKGFEVKKGGK
jgi:YHS domain-containing protein